MNTFGNYLKESREQKGIRLEEIASITKIHVHNLELMESGRWTELPPEPFIRGFIVAYCKYIGLDTKEAIRRFTEEQVTEVNLGAPESAAPVSMPNLTSAASPKASPITRRALPAETPDQVMEQTHTLPLGKILVATLSIAAVVGGIYVARLGKKASAPQVAEVSTPTKTLEVQSAPVAVVPSSETVADQLARAGVTPPTTQAVAAPQEISPTGDEGRKPAAAEPPQTVSAPVVPAAASVTAPQLSDAGPHEVVVEGKERTWVKVVVDDEAPTEFFLPEGEKATYHAKQKIKVVLGNATGTKVSHNGTENPGKKFSGTIRSYIFPNNARFPQDKPKPEEPATAPVSDADASVE